MCLSLYLPLIKGEWHNRSFDLLTCIVAHVRCKSSSWSESSTITYGDSTTDPQTWINAHRQKQNLPRRMLLPNFKSTRIEAGEDCHMIHQISDIVVEGVLVPLVCNWMQLRWFNNDCNMYFRYLGNMCNFLLIWSHSSRLSRWCDVGICWELVEEIYLIRYS